uniref:Uncharacterized protein n=1 Tax=Capra hircus TaxID=9925 RepID=A0A452G131_CAPHI
MPAGTPPAAGVLPAATMTEGVQAADEVRVPLGAPAPGPAAAAASSPASPGAPGPEAERGSGPSASPPESPAAEPGRRRGAARPVPGAGGHRLLLSRADHAAAQLVSPAGL